MPTKNQFELMMPVIDLLLPEHVQQSNVTSPIPVLDLPVADGRKWCQAALDWLEGIIPNGCPTADLQPNGTCRRSPCRGSCLLLLPGSHADWAAACHYRFDRQRQVIVLRTRPAPRPWRTPLVLEEMEVHLGEDRP